MINHTEKNLSESRTPASHEPNMGCKLTALLAISSVIAGCAAYTRGNALRQLGVDEEGIQPDGTLVRCKAHELGKGGYDPAIDEGMLRLKLAGEIAEQNGGSARLTGFRTNFGVNEQWLCLRAMIDRVVPLEKGLSPDGKLDNQDGAEDEGSRYEREATDEEEQYEREIQEETGSEGEGGTNNGKGRAFDRSSQDKVRRFDRGIGRHGRQYRGN